MVLNASHRELLDNTERFGGKKKFHPSTNVPHHFHLTQPSPYSRMPEDASNQYLTMLKPFNEQSMSLIDGVEGWEMELEMRGEVKNRDVGHGILRAALVLVRSFYGIYPQPTGERYEATLTIVYNVMMEPEQNKII